MIREITEAEMNEHFFEVMAEVECGSHFNFSNAKHIEWLRRRIAVHFLRGMKFFGYYAEERPVGFAAVLIDEGPEGLKYWGKWAELLDIGVKEESRGSGYGSELLKHIEQYCAGRGVYCLYMFTYARDYKAISFYGKNGYVPVATLPDVHGPGDEGHVYMRKVLQ